MRRHLPGFCAALIAFWTGTANAASDVSAQFDGVYAGTAEPAPAMGRAGCGAFQIPSVTIAKGFFQTTSGAQPSVTGFVTADGYVSASLTRPGRPRLALDGRLEGDTISAGLIDAEDNCYWVVRLTKSQ